jgi:ADP-heptose:LPS heptosyltransferase
VELVSAPTLGQLKALLGHARLVIGGDSGPEHVAAAMGARVLSLFGPTEPGRSGPRGRGDLRVLRRSPLRSLPVDEVIAAMAEFPPQAPAD